MSQSAARLQWRRVSAGVFYAYPEGPEHKADRHCSVGRFVNQATVDEGIRWAWKAHWEGRFLVAGIASEKQLAAELATKEWWRSLRETEAAYQLWQRTLPLIAAAVDGQPDLAAFELAAADRDHLTRVMREVTSKWRADGQNQSSGLKPLMAALSAELYARRLAASS
jgi:hypothetical protein